MIAAAALAAPSMAWATDTRLEFGKRGTAALGFERLFGVFHSNTRRELASGARRSDREISIGFGWSAAATSLTVPRFHLDVFIAPRWSVGFGAGVGATTGRRTSEVEDTERTDRLPTVVTFSFSPRVGYALPLSTSTSLWPRAGLTYTTDLETVNTPSGSIDQGGSSQLAATLDALLVLTPGKPVALTLGPVTDIPLSGVRGGVNETVFIVGGSVGALGWF